MCYIFETYVALSSGQNRARNALQLSTDMRSMLQNRVLTMLDLYQSSLSRVAFYYVHACPSYVLYIFHAGRHGKSESSSRFSKSTCAVTLQRENKLGARSCAFQLGQTLSSFEAKA